MIRPLAQERTTALHLHLRMFLGIFSGAVATPIVVLGLAVLGVLSRDASTVLVVHIVGILIAIGVGIFALREWHVREDAFLVGVTLGYSAVFWMATT